MGSSELSIVSWSLMSQYIICAYFSKNCWAVEYLTLEEHFFFTYSFPTSCPWEGNCVGFIETFHRLFNHSFLFPPSSRSSYRMKFLSNYYVELCCNSDFRYKMESFHQETILPLVATIHQENPKIDMIGVGVFIRKENSWRISSCDHFT